MLKLPKDKVAITPIFDPDQSPGGIWIPDQAKERCDQGIVKYIGPDVQWVKIGMYVMFSGYSGELIKMQGEGDLIILQEKYVVAEIGEVENIHVPGLYFRSKFDKNAAFLELREILNFILKKGVYDIEADVWSMNIDEIAQKLVDEGVIGPLTFPYFQADYENIFNFISSAFRDSDWYKGIKLKVEKEPINLSEND